MPETRYNYSYSIDLEHATTSHSLAILSVPPGSAVLDIGAADGSVARVLGERGCRIWAVEAHADMAAAARPFCESVVVGDIEELDLDTAFDGRRFDAILLLDVLEHLKQPLDTLKRVRTMLAPGGRVIVSLPNITHGAVRLSLLSGEFNYTETGLLDKTHLRFFNRRSAETLVQDAGLRILERLRVTRGLTETEIPIDPSTIGPDIVEMLEKDPDSTTYQFVLIAASGDGAPAATGVSLAELLQRRTEVLEAQYRELEKYTRSIEAQERVQGEQLTQLKAERATFEAELDARMREVAQGHLERRHLQSDLAVKDAFVTELRREIDRTAAEASSAFDAGFASGQDAGRDELRGMQEELRQLRLFRESAGGRLVFTMMERLGRYPRMYKSIRSLARQIAGRPRSS